MNSRDKRKLTGLVGLLASAVVLLAVASIPLNLSRPDDQPPSEKKPVKVYLLGAVEHDGVWRSHRG